VFFKEKTGRYYIFTIIFAFLVGALFLLNLSLGSVPVPLKEVYRVVLHQPVDNTTFQAVIWKIRLPRSLATLFGGAALATGGLLLQIFFRNPIVGPYVLGISSGATLLVALVMLTSLSVGLTLHPFALSMAAFLGALLVMILVLAVANRVRNVVTLLVVGLMMGYLCSAVSSILIALAEKEKVHGFVLWTLGSFSGFTWDELVVLMGLSGPLLLCSLLLCKPLNAFLLGEDYARSMGVNIRCFRVAIVMLASALAGLVTAFAGPVAFIGLAVPHMARLSLGTSDNRALLPATILLGATVASLCDLVARMALSPVELPISAITSFFGAPIVIGLLLKRRTAL